MVYGRMGEALQCFTAPHAVLCGRMCSGDVRQACYAVMWHRPVLSLQVGDGDCGSTLAKGAHSVLPPLPQHLHAVIAPFMEITFCIVLHFLPQVGDGDCGSTLAKGAQSVLGALDRLPADDLAATALAVAHLSECRGMFCRLPSFFLHVWGWAGGWVGPAP